MWALAILGTVSSGGVIALAILYARAARDNATVRIGRSTAEMARDRARVDAETAIVQRDRWQRVAAELSRELRELREKAVRDATPDALADMLARPDGDGVPTDRDRAADPDPGAVPAAHPALAPILRRGGP